MIKTEANTKHINWEVVIIRPAPNKSLQVSRDCSPLKFKDKIQLEGCSRGHLNSTVSSLPFRLEFKNDYRMLEKFKVILAIAGLVSFIAMLVGVARADRKVKRAIAEGGVPSFSWAWFIFSIYIFAQGIYSFIRECLLEVHSTKGVWVNYLFQVLAILLLTVGITAVSNQLRWLLHVLQRRG